MRQGRSGRGERGMAAGEKKYEKEREEEKRKNQKAREE